MSDDPIVVFMTAANGEEATRLAEMLVGAHLAACVQIMPEMLSINMTFVLNNQTKNIWKCLVYTHLNI